MSWNSVRGNDYPVVVSYYTDDFYLRDAFELVRTCQQFELDFDVRKVDCSGSWMGNTNAKPTWLRGMSDIHPNRAILWLDADARIRRMPHLFQHLKADIAYHKHGGRKASSGTVFMSPGNRNELLDAWIQNVKENPERTDQICMDQAMRKLGVSPWLLPVEYCWIFDFDASGHKFKADASSKPVIEHMQASRWRKNAHF